MKIALIIINYNGEFFLKKYLKFFEIISNNSNIDLIVTDDRSTDGSIKILKKINCKLTINNGNKGFAANVNNGIKFAKSLKEFDYYIIANNDIILNFGFENKLHEILNYIEVKFIDVGLIGFKEINEFKVSKSDESSYSLTEIYETNNIPGFYLLLTSQLLMILDILMKSILCMVKTMIIFLGFKKMDIRLLIQIFLFTISQRDLRLNQLQTLF